MGAGQLLGGGCLPGRDLGGDALVDLDGVGGLGRLRVLAAPGHRLRPGLFLGRPQRDEAADHVPDGRVGGERHQQVVELPRDPGERHAVAGQGGGLLDAGLELGNDRLGAVGPLGAFRGAQRFECPQPGPQVAECDPAGLQRQPEVVRRRRLVGAVHLSAADAAAPHRHQALGLEDADGFPDRRVADAELAHQLVLGREPVVGRTVARQDTGAQFTGHRLGDAVLRDAGAAGIAHQAARRSQTPVIQSALSVRICSSSTIGSQPSNHYKDRSMVSPWMSSRSATQGSSPAS